MTLIYLSEIHRYDGRISFLKDGLPEDIIQHCLKYQNEHDIQASLLAYNIIISTLKKEGVDCSKLPLNYNQYKKPYFSHCKLHFNISHSGDIVAVALSTSEVGIDIEMDDDKRDYDALAKRYFGPNELKTYQNSNQKIETFLSLWTKKEAFHKHVGDGIILGQFEKDIPYSDIYTTKLEDSFNHIYYLSCDCIDNEKVNLMII